MIDSSPSLSAATTTTEPDTVVLAGLESVGKSALFRGLTGWATGDEANFRGSTVVCRRCRSAECGGCEVVDTPGIRLEGDAETTRLALKAAGEASVVLMVARGTDVQNEVEQLLRELDLAGRRSVLAITFADKAEGQAEAAARRFQNELGIPVVTVNARDLAPAHRAKLVKAIHDAAPPKALTITRQPLAAPAVTPQKTWFEKPVIGPLAALLTMLLMFAGPVYAAYCLAGWLQPIADSAVIEPLKQWLAPRFSGITFDLLAGSYGLLTLGWYSFLWAFPVVLLIGCSTALVEEIGLKDRLADALDPWMRRFGLSGRDLMPVLTGFGCNVVAVHQSRGCSTCSRRACVSMISIGSACSYQIGATLSLFGSANRNHLFLPYLLLLAVIGLLHTRFWYGNRAERPLSPFNERAYLQWPKPAALGWRVRAVLKQFLWQAMPLFLLICLVAGLMAHFGIMDHLSRELAPALEMFRLPPETAPGLVFSILRKDGLLVLNQGEGALVQSLTAGQLLTLVFLASTLTACLVTLWAVGKELGWRQAGVMAGRQLLTSVVAGLLIAWLSLAA